MSVDQAEVSLVAVMGTVVAVVVVGVAVVGTAMEVGVMSAPMIVEVGEGITEE
jgi:hypothetical protein